MTATNCIGYEIQAYFESVGWIMESNGYSSMAEAQGFIDAMPADGLKRRPYESLMGY